MPTPRNSSATAPGTAPATARVTAATKIPLTLPQARPLGIAATSIIAVSSFLGGATRNRGGLLESIGLGFLSFGHGRNVGMLLFWIGLFALVGAWILAGRQVVAPALSAPGSPAGPADDAAFRRVRSMMWAWIIPLFFAAPVASRDVYSYLMQGAMVRDGFNPYSQGAAVNPGPFLLEVSQDWRNTTTPYGPLHLWIAEGVTRLVGSHVSLGIICFKAISLAGFAAIAWSVPRISEHLGSSRSLALWLGVANPVLILHLIGGMHNEAIMVGIVSLALVAATRKHFLTAMILVAVGVAVKVTAFFAMPFVIWIIVHHFAPKDTASGGRKWTVFVLSGAAAAGLAVTVLAVITWASQLSWGWLSEITGNTKVINPLAGPTLLTDIVAPLIEIFNPDSTYNSVLTVFRTIGMVLMLLGLVVVWWLSRGGESQAFMGTAAAYQVAFIFNSVTLPWYYASVITVLAAARPPMWLVKLAIGASIFVGLSFSSDGNQQLYNWWWTMGIAIASWQLCHWVMDAAPAGVTAAASPTPSKSETSGTPEMPKTLGPAPAE